MRYRLLGRTGVHVSQLSLGTIAYGGASRFCDIEATDAAGAVDQAYPEWMVARRSADCLRDGAPISRLPARP